ncbi:MAG: stage V sporulation protein S [Coriobacteriia bacterium]|nr:stage V sporulation protein S [Coriobacteriia bacterium]
MDYLKVSSKSSPASVAGAIAGLIKDGQPVEIQSVGAGAVNQAIKAVAIARGFLIPAGIDVACVPTFQDIEIDGECRTAIRLSVVPHTLTAPALSQLDVASDASSSSASRSVSPAPVASLAAAAAIA